MATYPTVFSKWGTDMVHRVFGLNDVKKHQSLTDWMNYNPPSVEGGDLALLQLSFERYHSRARYLSESDMKMKVLGPVIVASGFDNKDFSTFGEVLIKTTLTANDGTKLKVSGRPDLVASMGNLKAALPFFFCMQGYTSAKSDPQGQVLIEMLAARQANLDKGNNVHTIYGAFTLGRQLNFLTLENNTYALSKTYLLDVEQDLIDVTMRIRALKYIIGALIGVTF